jgi:hypothetical protein
MSPSFYRRRVCLWLLGAVGFGHLLEREGKIDYQPSRGLWLDKD